MLMEIWDTAEEKSEQLRRYQLCIEEFNELNFHDVYIAEIKQEYQQLAEQVKVQSTSDPER
ncbi:hypothetical protein KO533_15425 [Shewanella sp. NKUCC05_KAH]|uniref:Uncharacterized protein n=1 Tax=Shewanella oncorhynchi TaxID=2726434 RepID=A0ABX1KSF7_9GAMM|nr:MULTISPECIES: hypothetical protein [Shewanella]AVI66110.1 hypothetical protein CKQ84_09660 [Shewanella sp. WE21]MBI1674206.1 hypothetical protein [Shewanella sp. DW31]MBP6517504.1 hypothetical protein [Shewanella sp.]MBP8119069.1 hypothetical protein [Shewanella sp.]MBW3515934.1 hypothetical protein [Shewanella sp. NKUCC01_JLK]